MDFNTGKRRRNIEDVFFTGLNQAWRIISGPLTLILIPLYLTPELQGYWYTIIGLSLLMVFADLGFTSIILLFASHEFAHLKFDDKWNISGNENNLKRLASFFVFSLKWMIMATILVIPVIACISIFLLSQKPSDIHWFLPWLIYLAGSIILLFNNALLAFFEGCNLVGLVQGMRLIISVINTAIMCAGLILGYQLYALAYSLLISSLSGMLIILIKFRAVIRSFLRVYNIKKYEWIKELFPLLWRYAISWGSGYFIFQIYTPLMFYYHGAVEAGKVGISIALWAAIFQISNVWITSVIPRINIHVSRKEWPALDSMFLKRVALSLLTFIAGALAFFLFVSLLRGKSNILGRFMGDIPMFILAIAWFLQMIINSLAVYLRSHKQEPLVLPSFVGAVYIPIATVLCAKYFPPEYFFLGLLSSYILGLPWVMIIYFNKKKELAVKDERSFVHLHPNI